MIKISRNWVRIPTSKTASPSIREMINNEHLEKQAFCMNCLHFSRKAYGFGNADFGKCYLHELSGEARKLKDWCSLYTSEEEKWVNPNKINRTCKTVSPSIREILNPPVKDRE